MSKSVSISKTFVAKMFVAAITTYSHKFAGHSALTSAFVASYEDSPVIFLVMSAFPKTDKLNL